jgi:MarR family transcriptional regulator for hemolysin
MSETDLPLGTQTLIFSKLYYGALTKSLEHLDVERYYSVLLLLHPRKKFCQQQICNELMIDKTAMVKVMDYLSKSGCIQKEVNPEDRREHFISLSKQGEKAALEIKKSVKLIEKKLLKGIGTEEVQVFHKVLHQLAENVNQMPLNDLFFNYKRTK